MANDITRRFPGTWLDTDAGRDTAKLRDELAEAKDRVRDAQAALTAAVDARRLAPQRDAAEYAKATRAGKSDPGPIHRQQAEQDEAEARRRLDGEAAGVASITSDLEALHASKGTVWEADVVARLADARSEALALFDELRGSLERVAEYRRVESWIATGKAKMRAERVQMTGRAGPSPTLDDVLARLAAFLEDAAPESEPDVRQVAFADVE